MSGFEPIRIHGKDGNQERLLRFEHYAMHTVFGLLFDYRDEAYAEQAAHAAFMELDRLEEELSRYLPNSDISRINKLKRHESVVVSIDTFNCLRECIYLYNLTKGAFDISAGPLIDLWKPGDKNNGKLHEPGADEIENATRITGLPWLHPDGETFTVRLFSDSIRLDLGGYGKGYALLIMRETLREWGIGEAVLHSGHSTVLAYSEGAEKNWPLSFRLPGLSGGEVSIEICNQSISSSGLEKGSHIIDPRTGHPLENRAASWVVADRPDYADALSTAFLLMKDTEIEEVCAREENVSALVIERDPSAENAFLQKHFGSKRLI